MQYSSGLAQLFRDPINNRDGPRGSHGQTEVRALLSRKHEAHHVDGPNPWVVFAEQGAQSTRVTCGWGIFRVGSLTLGFPAVITCKSVPL